MADIMKTLGRSSEISNKGIGMRDKLVFGFRGALAAAVLAQAAACAPEGGNQDDPMNNKPDSSEMSPDGSTGVAGSTGNGGTDGTSGTGGIDGSTGGAGSSSTDGGEMIGGSGGMETDTDAAPEVIENPDAPVLDTYFVELGADQEDFEATGTIDVDMDAFDEVKVEVKESGSGEIKVVNMTSQDIQYRVPNPSNCKFRTVVIVDGVSYKSDWSDELVVVKAEVPEALTADNPNITVGPSVSSVDLTGTVPDTGDTDRIQISENDGGSWTDVTYNAGDATYKIPVTPGATFLVRPVNEYGEEGGVEYGDAVEFTTEVDSTAPNVPEFATPGPIVISILATSFDVDFTNVDSTAEKIRVYDEGGAFVSEHDANSTITVTGHTAGDVETYSYSFVDEYGNESDKEAKLTDILPGPTMQNLAVDCSIHGGICYSEGWQYVVTADVENADSCTAEVELIGGSGTPGSVGPCSIVDGKATFIFTTGTDSFDTVRITVTPKGDGDRETSDFIDIQFNALP